MYSEIINNIKNNYDIYNKSSLKYFINWKKKYKLLLPNLRISQNQSGNTLPVVPWFSISPRSSDFRVTVLFSVKDREPFISIQSATDGKKSGEIAAVKRMGSQLLLNETSFAPCKLNLQSGEQKSSNRPRNYESVSIMSQSLSGLNEEQIKSKIALYKIAADFLNDHNPNTLYIDDQQMKIAEELISTGVKFSVVASRIGHAKWKKLLLARFDNKCAICGIKTSSLLKGSHIVGWAKNEESRGDLNNGLILCPNHDSVFDKELISFNSEGEIMISDEIKEDAYLLGLQQGFKLDKNFYNGVKSNVEEYMKVHEKNFKEKNGKR